MPSDPLLSHVVTFGRVLREVGLEVGPGRLQDALRGLDAVDLTEQEDVYWALRQTLVSRRDELELFDRAFAAWFLRAPVMAPLRAVPQPQAQAVTVAQSEPTRPGDEADEAESDPLELGASAVELLREKDFSEMTADEFKRVRALMTSIARLRPQRASRRRTASSRGESLDMRRLVRRSLRTGGDPLDRPHRARKDVPRKLVVLCDVSGSMEAYTRALARRRRGRGLGRLGAPGPGAGRP
jgi:uncharacterized protein with von Willebrand factor type A (vWA) domain